MAKVLFVQREAAEKFGVMSLSAVLKRDGHEVELFLELLEKKSIFDFIKRFQPDYIAFSITSIEKDWAIKLSAKIKKIYKVYSVFGGAEPTYNPEIINLPAIDFVCRGEGEKGLLELIKRIDRGESLKGIQNFWVKEKGKIIKNPLGSLRANLNDLPLPDRTIYYKYPLLANLSTKKFLCSRGCPYSCTYCSNHAYHKLFKNLGQFIRFRKPEIIIEEIIKVKKEYGLKNVYFSDETFTLNHEWLYELLKLYRKKIKLPFSCLARANELDEKTVRELKKSGCFYIAFGLESGSERIRNEILKRNMSNEVLFNAAKLLKKYNIPFLTHEMFVLPTETLAEAYQTVEMNIKMGTDSVWGTVFQPFRNTEIYEYCKERKLINDKIKAGSTHGQSVIKNQHKKEISNLRKIDWLIIKFPWTFPLAKKIVYLPDNIFFRISLRLSEVYSIKRRWRLGIWEMIRLAIGTGDIFG